MIGSENERWVQINYGALGLIPFLEQVVQNSNRIVLEHICPMNCYRTVLKQEDKNSSRIFPEHFMNRLVSFKVLERF